jgi:hypothetical protein
VLVALLAAQPACDDEAPDGTGMVIEVGADQPESLDLGVSVALHARGGSSLFVSLDQGVFLGLTDPGTPPVARPAHCFASPAAQPGVFTIELSVRPTDREALLFASLYADSACAGQVVQSRLVAVHPPAVNPVAVDGGVAVDASVTVQGSAP